MSLGTLSLLPNNPGDVAIVRDAGDDFASKLRCVVVFELGGKKYGFAVSEVSNEPSAVVSDARVRAALEMAPDGMLLVDGFGCIQMVNRQVEKLFGYDRETLLELTIEDLLPERFRGKHRAHRTRYQADPLVRVMGAGLDLWARRADGAEFPVEISLSPISDENGHATVVSIRDVSDRHFAEERERLFRAGIDATNDGVYIFSALTTRFLYVNDGAVRQSGYSRDELLTMTPMHLNPGFSKSAFVAAMDSIENGEPFVPLRTILRPKSGSDFPVQMMLNAPSVAKASMESFVVAIVHDMSFHVASEAALKQSEWAFRAAFEQAPVGMLTARLDVFGNRTLTDANEELCVMLGRTKIELVGSDLAELSHPDDAASDREAALEMQEGNRELYVTEKRYRRADGTYVWVLLHSKTLVRNDTVTVIAHVIDISDRKEAEAEKLRLSVLEDRERIALDLHSSVIQRLFSAGTGLQSIGDRYSEVDRELVRRVVDELDLAIAQLRSAVFRLADPKNDNV
jgi:PAS domain S-box-containing protein